MLFFSYTIIYKYSLLISSNKITAGSLMKYGLLTELLGVTWALSPGAMRVDWQFILCSAETV
jgi:hypothetical protein